MKTLRTSVLGVLAVGAVLALGGCQSAGSSNNSANMGAVNSRCPIMPDHALNTQKVTTTQYKGQTVAFCCAGCIPEWNRLSDAQKDAALVAAR